MIWQEIQASVSKGLSDPTERRAEVSHRTWPVKRIIQCLIVFLDTLSEMVH